LDTQEVCIWGERINAVMLVESSSEMQFIWSLREEGRWARWPESLISIPIFFIYGGGSSWLKVIKPANTSEDR
jgi:hypothetical protein